MNTLYTNDAGHIVEIVPDSSLPPGVPPQRISFAAQGGGFVQSLPADEFERHFRPTALPGFSLTAVSGEWMPEGESLPAYSNGQRWNGWAMPYFTKETALGMLKDNPNVRFDEQQDAFVITAFDDEAEDTVCPATLITVDDQQIKTYAIGAGEWCWDLAPQEDVQQATQADVDVPRERR